MAQRNSAATRQGLLEAARACLTERGFAALSTRTIADRAGVPLSQLHYHFGSKEKLVLALLAAENERRLARQAQMYDADMPLWKQWEQACDFLDDDLSSGYVRVLQEMISTGWSNPKVAAAVRGYLLGWYELLSGVAERAAAAFDGLGPFTAAEVAALVGNAFLGAEALLLLGVGEAEIPITAALRRVGEVMRTAENR